MTLFYKDIWHLLLLYIDNPTDYKNAALICKTSSRAAKDLKEKKAIEYSSLQCKYNNGVLYQKSYYLPNQQLHGKFETYIWMGDYCMTNTKEFSFGSLKTENNNSTTTNDYKLI